MIWYDSSTVLVIMKEKNKQERIVYHSTVRRKSEKGGKLEEPHYLAMSKYKISTFLKFFPTERLRMQSKEIVIFYTEFLMRISSCFVVFFHKWNEWKNPQFNFWSQNLSIERNFLK